jgi:predicted glycosyltransferase
MTARPALLFYCQHSVGLGHLMRSYALCAGLTERFRVVLVCGGPVPRAIRSPDGVEVVTLPALGVGASGRFVSHDARFTVDEAWAARRERILATFRALRPAVVLVELFPFGRAKFARELVPLLEEARAAGAVTACSLRDILVSRRADQQAHDDRARALADAHLDAVLVHSDPAFARLEETFAPSAPLAVPVRYTGFVVRDPVPGPAMRPRGRVVVSAGGGLVGERLLQTAAAAQRRLWPSTGATMRLIAGPLLPDDAWDRLHATVARLRGTELVRSVPDLAAELRAASVSVSQAGYNTVLEVIGAGVPALVVPYATPEEDEQLRRARRLERLGAVRVLDPDRLDPAALAREIRRLFSFAPRPAAVDVGGVAATCRILHELVRPEVAA